MTITRSPLGAVVAALLSMISDLDNDPIAPEFIGHSSYLWHAREISTRHGWSLAEIFHALDTRVSAKWVYQSGIAALEPIGEDR